jgi:hypothetical protein
MAAVVRLLIGIFIATATAFIAGCDDDLGIERVAVVQDTVVLYSLARADRVGLPSAFDFFYLQAMRVEHASATGNWDVALSESNGRFVLVPPGVFTGLDLRAGIASAGGTAFENLTEAPGEDAAYVREQTVPLQEGVAYVVRSRRLDACSVYAKLRLLQQDVVEGSVRFEYLANPNCGDRGLSPDP